ncbi:MAG TPA: FAD-dependent oxidoreductase [Tepidisphaeraceae bacterium]|jgi:NAD(P)H-nitrite reductase large subunit
MDRMHVKYLLAGGGVASAACAEAIRELDRSEAILLVAQEISRPYDRAPLSKAYLRRETAKPDLVSQTPTWFAQNDVTLRTGRRLTQVDTARGCAHLDDGGEIFYDRLLLAVGRAPRPLGIPGGTLPNTFHLKTIADADRLHHAIEISRTAGHNRAVVIGAGLLGVEVAASLAQVGMHVDLIAAYNTVWPKLVGEQCGAFLARRLARAGVKLHANRRAARLEGDGRVQRVVLDDGQTIGTDFVVAAVGSGFNRELLRHTPVAAENAILTDETGRTNVANIYAAGDCATIFDRRFGKHRPASHWDHARATGRVCGVNMAGGQARYDRVTHFTSEVAGLTVHVWGDARFVSHRILRGNARANDGHFAEIGVAADGRVAQVIAVGRENEHDALRRLVEDRAATADAAEAMKDPAIALA